MNTQPAFPHFLNQIIHSTRIVIVHSALTDIRKLVETLQRQGLDYRLYEMSMADHDQRTLFQELSQLNEWHHLPMIYLDGRFIGGEPELHRALKIESGIGLRPMAW